MGDGLFGDTFRATYLNVLFGEFLSISLRMAVMVMHFVVGLIFLSDLLDIATDIFVLVVRVEILAVSDVVDELAKRLMGGELFSIHVVVGLAPLGIHQSRVSLAQLQELLLGFRIICSVLRMHAQALLPEGLVDIREIGITRHSQNVIVASFASRTVLVEEFLLVLTNTIALEESIECRQSMFLGKVMPSDQLIVVIATSLVGQHCVSFADVSEIPLGNGFIAFVLSRVPLLNQLFICFVKIVM
jgi:hypothetical protein